MTHQESLYGKTPDQLAALCGELGMPRFAAKQLARWLYAKHVEDPMRMSDIAAAHRAGDEVVAVLSAQAQPAAASVSPRVEDGYICITKNI